MMQLGETKVLQSNFVAETSGGMAKSAYRSNQSAYSNIHLRSDANIGSGNRVADERAPFLPKYALPLLDRPRDAMIGKVITDLAARRLCGKESLFDDGNEYVQDHVHEQRRERIQVHFS